MLLQAGDILFQNIGCGSICEAINDVTYGVNNARIDHCAIVVDAGRVIEAIYPRVTARQTPAFLGRVLDAQARPKVLVGRVALRFRDLIPAALAACEQQIGKNYDLLFSNDDNSLYCSELIGSAFAAANGGADFFQKRPMSFKDKITGEIHPVWIRYFKNLGKPVPEGTLGSNPGELSKASQIEIIHQYGDLDGSPKP